MTGINIDLNAGKKQPWGAEGQVSFLPETDEVFARGAGFQLDVFLFLLGHGTVERKRAAAGHIIVADIELIVIRKLEELIVDRIIKVLGAAGWEITAARAIVRHEDGVADEDRLTDDIAGAGRCVAWGMESVDF